MGNPGDVSSSPSLDTISSRPNALLEPVQTATGTATTTVRVNDENEGEEEEAEEEITGRGNNDRVRGRCMSTGNIVTDQVKSFLQYAEQRAEASRNRIPVIRKVPLRAIAIILFIALLNSIVWIATGIVVVSILFANSPRYV